MLVCTQSLLKWQTDKLHIIWNLVGAGRVLMWRGHTAHVCVGTWTGMRHSLHGSRTPTPKACMPHHVPCCVPHHVPCCVPRLCLTTCHDALCLTTCHDVCITTCHVGQLTSTHHTNSRGRYNCRQHLGCLMQHSSSSS